MRYDVKRNEGENQLYNRATNKPIRGVSRRRGKDAAETHELFSIPIKRRAVVATNAGDRPVHLARERTRVTRYTYVNIDVRPRSLPRDVSQRREIRVSLHRLSMVSEKGI